MHEVIRCLETFVNKDSILRLCFISSLLLATAACRENRPKDAVGEWYATYISKNNTLRDFQGYLHKGEPIGCPTVETVTFANGYPPMTSVIPYQIIPETCRTTLY